MDSHDEVFVWVRNYRAIIDSVILLTETLENILGTIWHRDTSIFFQSLKNLLFVRFVRNILGIL